MPGKEIEGSREEGESQEGNHKERKGNQRMDAVIATGGKQYRVAPGQVIKVERLVGTTPGATVEFAGVVLVTRDGQVTGGADLRGAKVVGEVIGERRDPKVRVVKFKRRKNYRRLRGHRQLKTSVRITRIEV
jgi:large subunit ribosomal protein L21